MPLRAARRFSRRHDGDFHIDGDPTELARRRTGLQTGAWTWLRQVHGSRVVIVDRPGAHAGAEADAAVTTVAGAVLAVHTADCAPVLLRSRVVEVVGAVHVGWRGLVAGVLEATLDAMGELGAESVEVVVGPHIRSRCYEFGPDDLDVVAERCGPAVRSETAWGTPALDLLAGIRSALADRDGIVGIADHGGCTACEHETYFSHRARGDRGRMAATTVLAPAGPEEVPA